MSNPDQNKLAHGARREGESSLPWDWEEDFDTRHEINKVAMPRVTIKRKQESKPEPIPCECGGTYRQVYAVFGLLWECDSCGDVIQSESEATAKDDLPLLVCQ